MRYFLLLFLCAAVSFGIVRGVSAQTPASSELIVTWHANNYYPADFRGKARVTPRTRVSVSVQVLEGGRLATPSDAVVVWRLDGATLARGAGLFNTVFTARALAGTDHNMRVMVERKGVRIAESLFRIPVVHPELVFEHAFPNRVLRSGTQATLRLIPYFFNVASLNDLRFFWQVGGEAPKIEDGDNTLTLTVGPFDATTQEQSVLVTGVVQNIANELESVRERLLFHVVR